MFDKNSSPNAVGENLTLLQLAHLKTVKKLSNEEIKKYYSSFRKNEPTQWQSVQGIRDWGCLWREEIAKCRADQVNDSGSASGGLIDHVIVQTDSEIQDHLEVEWAQKFSYMERHKYIAARIGAVGPHAAGIEWDGQLAAEIQDKGLKSYLPAPSNIECLSQDNSQLKVLI